MDTTAHQPRVRLKSVHQVVSQLQINYLAQLVQRAHLARTQLAFHLQLAQHLHFIRAQQGRRNVFHVQQATAAPQLPLLSVARDTPRHLELDLAHRVQRGHLHQTSIVQSLLARQTLYQAQLARLHALYAQLDIPALTRQAL